MQVEKIMVDETPYAIWDWELQKKNVRFLKGIDPEYYRYVANVNSGKLEDDDKQRAALALRINYYQALETFFALLAATIQAPKCPLGWMLTYKDKELKNVINNITLEHDIYTRLKDKEITWKGLAHLVHKNAVIDNERKTTLCDNIGMAWKRFADDFLKDSNYFEYNSAKHGLRIMPGGFYLSIGKAEQWGIPAPPEKMECLGGSNYGSSFFVKTRISENDNINFGPREMSINWNPHNLANGLMLLGMSINNIVNFLLIVNGVHHTECKFYIPNSTDDYEKPWEQHVAIQYFETNTVIDAKEVILFSKNDIVDSFVD